MDLVDSALKVGNGRRAAVLGGTGFVGRPVRLLIEVSGVPTALVEAHPAAPTEPTWQQMRIDRARRLLGWSPLGDLSDGMKELWEYHAENPRG